MQRHRRRWASNEETETAARSPLAAKGHAAGFRLALLAALALAGVLSLNLGIAGVALASQARPAASTINILSETQTVRYPSTMTFTLQASDSAGSINSAHLIIDVPPEQLHHDITVPVDQPAAQIALSYTYDASNDYLPPFTPVTYHWVLGDGTPQDALTSIDRQFDFEDTRFTWSHLSQNDLTVYWYKQGSAFGQQLLSTAVSEATSIEQDLQGTLSAPIRIFAYQSDQDLRGGLPPNTPNWAGGVALVELHQALIVVGNTEGHPLQRDLPHELTHLIFHEVAGLGCGDCPLWFDEGMAVYHQVYHEPEMQNVFDQTVRNNRLLLLRTLTDRFPNDSNLAELAYAQSWNFVTYLYQHFGEPKVASLVHALNTTEFDQAFPSTFGSDVAHLESQWHVSLGLPPTQSTAPGSPPESGAENPAPINSAGHSDQLVAAGVLLSTLLLIGLVGGYYVWWRRRQALALAPGGAPLPYSPPADAFGQPSPEHLAQAQLALAEVTAREQQLAAQHAQLQAQLAYCAAQEQSALDAKRRDLLPMLQGQRQQLESQLALLHQQLLLVRFQKLQLSATSFPATGSPGAPWPPPGGAARPGRRVSQE